MSRTFFAYHLTHYFGEFNRRNYYTNSTKPTTSDLVYVISGDTDEENLGVDYSLEGVFRIKRRDAGPWPLQSMSGVRRNYMFKLSMEPVQVPDNPISLDGCDWYSRKEMHRFFSSGQNFNPLPLEPNFKERFENLLAESGLEANSELIEDLLDLELTVPDETERKSLAKARIGQGKFRAAVVSSWRNGETCALTGLRIPEMLVASHIKPWRDLTNKERLDPANGLLLAAHVDKLFDRYLLSFIEERGGFVTVIHPRIRGHVAKFGVIAGAPLRTSQLGFNLAERFGRFMSNHHAQHLLRVKYDTE